MFPALAGFKIKAHEDFNHRNILNISRIEIRMQRPAEAGGEKGRFSEVSFKAGTSGHDGMFSAGRILATDPGLYVLDQTNRAVFR